MLDRPKRHRRGMYHCILRFSCFFSLWEGYDAFVSHTSVCWFFFCHVKVPAEGNCCRERCTTHCCMPIRLGIRPKARRSLRRRRKPHRARSRHLLRLIARPQRQQTETIRAIRSRRLCDRVPTAQLRRPGFLTEPTLIWMFFFKAPRTRCAHFLRQLRILQRMGAPRNLQVRTGRLEKRKDPRSRHIHVLEMCAGTILRTTTASVFRVQSMECTMP
jgi:hypothetical protein